MRLALGAGRGRLVRQLLTESLCLAVAGGLCGLGLAFALRAGAAPPARRSHRPAGDARRPRAALRLRAHPGGRAACWACCPRCASRRRRSATGLRDQGRGIAGSAAWLRIGRLVVVGQLALSLPLLVGAGLLARTLVNLQRADLGYAKDGLLTVRVDAQAAGYEPARQAQAFEDLLRASAPCPASASPRSRTTGSSAARTTATRSPSRATRRRATAIADRATTRSGPATSRRSACR